MSVHTIKRHTNVEKGFSTLMVYLGVDIEQIKYDRMNGRYIVEPKPKTSADGKFRFTHTYKMYTSENGKECYIHQRT